MDCLNKKKPKVSKRIRDHINIEDPYSDDTTSTFISKSERQRFLNERLELLNREIQNIKTLMQYDKNYVDMRLNLLTTEVEGLKREYDPIGPLISSSCSAKSLQLEKVDPHIFESPDRLSPT